jgi:hypothetical protein
VVEQTVGVYPGCDSVYEEISFPKRSPFPCLASELPLCELASLLGGGQKWQMKNG